LFNPIYGGGVKTLSFFFATFSMRVCAWCECELVLVFAWGCIFMDFDGSLWKIQYFRILEGVFAPPS